MVQEAHILELDRLARPLNKFIQETFSEHTCVIVGQGRAELLVGHVGLNFNPPPEELEKAKAEATN